MQIIKSVVMQAALEGEMRLDDERDAFQRHVHHCANAIKRNIDFNVALANRSVTSGSLAASASSWVRWGHLQYLEQLHPQIALSRNVPGFSGIADAVWSAYHYAPGREAHARFVNITVRLQSHTVTKWHAQVACAVLGVDLYRCY